jgi:hypothetical protein
MQTQATQKKNEKNVEEVWVEKNTPASLAVAIIPVVPMAISFSRVRVAPVCPIPTSPRVER